ncbi:MAG TPA: hypothetical protein VFA52_00785 [Candidatus Paceibacterota bacterium]|nr:hypothetical protein [Candidatus Paceibacterota bacterium]
MHLYIEMTLIAGSLILFITGRRFPTYRKQYEIKTQTTRDLLRFWYGNPKRTWKCTRTFVEPHGGPFGRPENMIILNDQSERVILCADPTKIPEGALVKLRLRRKDESRYSSRVASLVDEFMVPEVVS